MRIYENPKSTSENRLNARSWYIPEGSCKQIMLNGEWRFAFFENGDRAGNIEEWETIEVPSCWQLKGYENPNYTNIRSRAIRPMCRILTPRAFTSAAFR